MFILEVSYGCPSLKYPLNGIFQLDQAKSLQDAGHRVLLIAIDLRSIKKWRKWGFFEHDFSGIHVCEFNFPLGPILPRIRTELSQFAFQQILSNVINKYGKPDIVHAHFGGTAICVVDACKKEDIPYVVTEHSSHINRDDLTENEIALYQYVYHNAAAVIAVSNTLANRIRRYSGVEAIVIPNIVDFSLFSTEKFPHDDFQLIAAGTLKPNKGFDVLIEAFNIYSKDNKIGKLLIMGDGPEKERLITLTRKLQITDRVSFFGKYTRDQFAKQLSMSDGFVLASKSETFGVVYAEALASGVPVIATRCGGPEDFVNDTNGFLVPVDDTKALACKIEELYKTRDRFKSDNIASNVRSQFSGENVAGKLMAVFRQCRGEKLEDSSV